MSDEFRKEDEKEEGKLPDEDEMKVVDNVYQTSRSDEPDLPENADEQPKQEETPEDEPLEQEAMPEDEQPEQEEKPENEAENQDKPQAVIHKPAEDKEISFPEKQPVAEPKQRSKAASVFNKIIMVIAILVFVVSASVIIKHYVDIRKNQKEAQRLAELVTEDTATETTTEAVGADGILEKYREAYNTNNDLVGWIKVPNTAIDHPVVQAKDNNAYLRKSFYGVYERRGTIFMDYRDHADELCKNTILYGHNYLDSTMFSDLEKYKDIEFYKTAPIIEFNTIYKSYQWQVFAVFLTNADDADDNGYIFNYIYPFMTDDNFESYIDELTQRSLYFTPVKVDKTDKILTLSTCTRDMDIKGNGETNARCVVVARLVKDGENAAVDTSPAVKNDNPRYPQIWYKAHGLTNPYVNAQRWYPEGVEY